MILNYTVSWLDENNKRHSKTYQDDKLASKAKRWLAEKGMVGIDLSVSLAKVKDETL